MIVYYDSNYDDYIIEQLKTDDDYCCEIIQKEERFESKLDWFNPKKLNIKEKYICKQLPIRIRNQLPYKIRKIDL